MSKRECHGFLAFIVGRLLVEELQGTGLPELGTLQYIHSFLNYVSIHPLLHMASCLYIYALPMALCVFRAT